MDRITLGSSNEREKTGIYEPKYNQIRTFEEISYTQVKPDGRLKAEILPASERDEYTKQDALLNQYMKQYRIDAKISGNSISMSSDQTVRIILPDMVSDEELEEFRKSLSENGLGSDIDWQGVKNDLWNMGVDFDNAERLETKTDYLASRYAVLKNRIEKEFTGDEQTEQMDILGKRYQDAKEEMADRYASRIGGFYEDLGQKGAAEEFRTSVMEMVDKKADMYEAYISEHEDYARVTDSDNAWLLQDDAYMAAQLRKSQVSLGQDGQMAADSAKYDMDDLMFAGVNSIFVPYMDKFMDAVDQVLSHQRSMVSKNSWMSGTVRTSELDRNRVMDAYRNAMG